VVKLSRQVPITVFDTAPNQPKVLAVMFELVAPCQPAGGCRAKLEAVQKEDKKVSLLPISAAFDQGVEKFKDMIREAVEEASE